MKSTSDFYVLGGTLPRDAPSYAVRKADEDLLDGLRRGQFCYVLTSRQMGKSSLMVRTVTRLRQERVTCLVIDLTATGQNLSEDQWYDGLLNCVATDLGLEDELDDFWQDNKRLGPLQRWMHALRSIVLTHVTGPVVIFIDEVDAVRSLPFSADEFFAGVRECYNRRTEDPEFNRLTFCLMGVATPADLIRDTRSTPFNIGKRIALTDFTEAEAVPLAEGLAQHGEGVRERGGEWEKLLLNRVLYWTHGHPYLTQRLCSAVSESLSAPTPNTQHLTPGLVDRICNEIFLSPGAQATDDNLLFVRERLLRADCDTTSLLVLYDKVRAGKSVPNSDSDYQISVLRLSGVVRVENGVLCVRNRIYAHVFDRVWVKRNIPGVELRRQRSAFRRGALGSALAGAALLLLFVAGFMLTHHQKHLKLRVPLPDGTQLIVNDVTFGTESAYDPGAFRWSALFGRPHATASFTKPTLSIWLSRYDPQTGKTVPFTNFDAITAVDEHGHYFLSTGAISTTDNVTNVDFENFPRRNKTIHLQLNAWSRGSKAIKTEFDIPNPTQTLYPLWTPEPLPSTKSVGNLAVTLKSVTWLDPQRSVRNGLAVQDDFSIMPAYECTEGGRQTRSWQTESIQLSDATGNSSSASGSVGGSMCIYEPAWRLRLRLSRRSESNFAPSETWSVLDVKMPSDGNVSLLTEDRSINGVRLRPLSIAAAQSVTYSDSASPTPSGKLGKRWGEVFSMGVSGSSGTSRFSEQVSGPDPQIAVRVSGLKADQKLTAWATDSSGRRYDQVGEGGITPINTADDAPFHILFLSIPPSVRKVDLHFAILDIKTVEFMVRPPLPVTESGSRK